MHEEIVVIGDQGNTNLGHIRHHFTDTLNGQMKKAYDT